MQSKQKSKASLETTYCFRVTHFDTHLLSLTHTFLAELRREYIDAGGTNIAVFERCVARLDLGEYNNLYDFLGNLLKNVFKTKYEQAVLHAAIDRCLLPQIGFGFVDVRGKNEEFDV